MTAHQTSNRSRIGMVLGLCLWAAGPSTLAAQEGQANIDREARSAAVIDHSPAHEMTLSEALDLARKNNRDLQAARVRLQGSKSDLTRAWSAIYPRITAQLKYTYNNPDVSIDFAPFATILPPQYANLFPSGPSVITPKNELDGIFAATLPLIAPSSYATVRAAKQTYRSQEKQLEVTVAQLLQSVASAFYAAAGNDELVAARAHAIDVARQTLDNARARLEAGVVNRVEVSRAELALVQAEQRLVEAEDNRRSSYLVLDTLVLFRQPFKVVAPGEPQIDSRSDGELVLDALHQRPEVPSLEAQALAFRYTAHAAALNWLPTISAFGNIRLTNATGFVTPPRYDFYTAGVQLDWLIFDGFERDARRHAAEAQARDAQLRLTQLRDTIADDVLNARRGALTRQVGLRTAQRSVQLSQETLDLVRLQYEAGTATQLELLTAQDNLIVSQVALAQARFDLSLSDISLRRLIGSFPGAK